MYSVSDICAVIISYNDADAIANNILSIIGQVDRVIIIDNASNQSCVDKLKQIEKNYNLYVIYSDTNMGIAFQLNQALNYCVEQKYRLLLTMDQDTKLTEGCVDAMLSVMNEDPEHIVSVGPDREYPKWKNSESFREKKYLITSGNLVNVKTAIDVGGYFNDLFIDMVDVDFSLALKCKGYKVCVATNAQMIHKVGEKETKTILGVKREYLSHRPERYYYIYRNRQIVCRKFFWKKPLYCLFMWFELFRASFGIVLEQQALKKIRMANKGFIDGIRFTIRKGNE